MKPSKINAALGIVLIGIGIFLFVKAASMAGIVPVLVGGTLIYQAFNRGRVATLIFGHILVVVGAYLITWGILLLPHSQPAIAHIFGRPLFWGIFSLMGGICAIFHGFCRCVTKQVDQFEQGLPLKN
jgi:uncharacterized membrane protein HdeD (DUF308 family)